jgi:hypothetical protein
MIGLIHLTGIVRRLLLRFRAIYLVNTDDLASHCLARQISFLALDLEDGPCQMAEVVLTGG